MQSATGAWALALAALLVFSSWVPPALAEGKPKLSHEIRTVLEVQGAAAARQRFADIYPSGADPYDIDMQGMAELGQAYMLAGDMEKGMAVMEMNSLLAEGMVSSMLQSSPTGSSAEVMAHMQEQERLAQQQRTPDDSAALEQDQSTEQAGGTQSRGDARSDLDRFTGLYGPQGDKRNLWVMKSCDGYLVAGASWGDAANWWLRSVADSRFTYQDSFIAFTMEFTEDPGGMRMAHTLGSVIASPLTRGGPLPADWGDCLERPLP